MTFGNGAPPILCMAVVLALAVTVVLDVAVAVTVAMAVVLAVGRGPSPSCQLSSRRGCRSAFFAAVVSLAITVKVNSFLLLCSSIQPCSHSTRLRQQKYCLYFGV